MKNRKYLIKITNCAVDCWVAKWHGDPGRTVVKKNAKYFFKKENAEAEASRLRKKYEFDYEIVEQ